MWPRATSVCGQLSAGLLLSITTFSWLYFTCYYFTGCFALLTTLRTWIYMLLYFTYCTYFALLNFDASYFDLHAAITLSYCHLLYCTYRLLFVVNFTCCFLHSTPAITLTYCHLLSLTLLYLQSTLRSAFYELLFTFDACCRCYVDSAAALLCFTLLYFDTLSACVGYVY